MKEETDFYYRPRIIKHYLNHWDLLEEGIAPRQLDGMPRKPDYWESSYEEAASIKADLECAIKTLSGKERSIILRRYIATEDCGTTCHFLNIIPSEYYRTSARAIKHMAETLGWRPTH